MAKKAKSTEYKVLIGFDVPAGRYEIGEIVKDTELMPNEIKALIDAKAIEKNGDS